MAETTDARVAVYLDFDNIVMSWYDRVHGRNSYSKDRQKIAEDPTDPEVAAKLALATIDVGAIIDYAASFGTLVLTRAYADWSSPVNAIYRSQLVGRAVDLVQLFPAAAYAKNGADIRLAVDTVEDMFRLPDLTHVVIVAGDSDYVPLAQRCKRLGRYVIGLGVAGSTAKSLAAACDEFEAYDTLPGVTLPKKPKAAAGKAETKEAAAAEATGSDASTAEAATTQRSRRASRAKQTPPPEEDTLVPFDEIPPEDLHAAASRLLERALRLGRDKGDDAEWLHTSAVKQHMRRMDPSFSEKTLGFRSFTDFVKSREQLAEVQESGHERLVRLKD
ncbi:NYN domain-containing protein [Microbacterium paludicola]|uniref:NYN domain-containing protein n=1 Tax=Microbacterium paludicola TaxID=300019 RepID=A0A4Y9G0X1_9MICO|nr:NYN domain-containing protein [Microbacterium paludicola]MBF0815122.1 NYN domain-containing protein [Microbacterium paludicola]TFU34391.1 NYN domain-containing protein [Microbacterium paludicola]